ncbi:MAG: hypothetical protein J1F12_09095 [Muribaculaceae bacterium]|nr:hypothetical protein [Muribaculaceae bacterium]
MSVKKENVAENANNQPAENQNSANASTVNKEVKKQKIEDEKYAKAIYNFMVNSNPCELEALRGIIIAINSETAVENDEKYAINRFLNHGMNNLQISQEAVMAHRIGRSNQLLQSVSRFLDKEQLVRASKLLSNLSIDRESVEYAIKVLSERNRTYGNSNKTNNTVNSNPLG